MKNRFFPVVLLLIAVLAFAAVSVSVAQDAVSVQIDMEHPYAAFLESRLYAAEMGATAEFRKMEWVAIDENTNTLYLAMSEVARGMADGEGDISVDENRCGIVYSASLDENYNMTELKPLLAGGPFDENGGENRCALDNVSNPDALFVDSNGRLWIGEDTGNHENNMIWVYNPADGSLKRFGYVPLGAEVTGIFVAENGTLFFSNQHPDANNLYPFNAGTVVAVTGFDANNDDFEEIAVPEGDAKLTAAVAAGEIQVLGRAGDVIPNSIEDEVLGGIYNTEDELMYVNNDPDGIMWLPVDEAGTQGWLYVNFEGRPGGVSRMFLVSTEAGWEVVDGGMVDFSSVMGTWNNCGSSVTPWGTALTSEEYEPVSQDLSTVNMMSDYLGEQANPYDYGYIIEMAPDELGDELTKLYTLGRKSNENSFVMADGKTVYFGDDGSDTVLFKFVADEAGDLTVGTLYAAKVTQTGGTADLEHAFELEWIELGYAANDDIAAAVAEMDLGM